MVLTYITLGFLLGLNFTVLIYHLRKARDSSHLEQPHSESLQVLQTFYEHVPTLLGVVELVDKDIRHLYDNAAARRFFGAPPEGSQGQLESQLGVDPLNTAVWLQRYEESLALGAPVQFQFKAPGERWFAVTVSPIRDAPAMEHLLCYLAEDISEHRKREELLALEMRQKDEFFSIAAHELRNPLTPLRTGLEIFKRDPTGTAAQQARTMMERQVLNLVQLIDDLLDISRIRLGRLKVQKAPTTVQSIVDKAIKTTAPLMEAHKHTLTVTLPPEPIALIGDLSRLVQIVVNLLTNAATYTPDGGKIELKASELNQTVTILVTDNGMGISSETLKRIFNMPDLAPHTPPKSGGSLGAGLPIVHRLVELHSGTIQASSAGDGRGSTFTVTIPTNPTDTVAPKVAQAQVLSSHTPYRKILIVDDHIEGAESLAMFLTMQGHTTKVANTPSEALKLFSEFKPDLMFIDVALPEMSGYELARHIRSSPSGNTVDLVAITGSGVDKEGDRARAMTSGFNAHLVKPLDLKDIQKLAEGGEKSVAFNA